MFASIIATLALILAVIALLISISRNKPSRVQAPYEEAEKENKVAQIIANYIKNLDQGIDQGIGGLIRAGIAQLSTENQIKEVLFLIRQRTGESPLGEYKEKLNNVNLLEFFKLAEKQGGFGQDAIQIPIDDLIKQVKK